jgi:hypothetical protein
MLISIVALAFSLLTQSASADILSFGDFTGNPALDSTSDYSGFRFSSDGPMARANATCTYICRKNGVTFPFLVNVTRVDGGAFDLAGIYVGGGLNYDGASTELNPGNATLTTTGADGIETFSQKLTPMGFASTNAMNVRSFTLRYTQGTPSLPPLFNDLTYTLRAAAPEPASWTLMILGFGAMGYSMRRKKAVVRFT